MTNVYLTFTFQLGLWVWLTLLPTLIVNYKKDDHRLGYRDYAGWALWVVGMAIEMVADYQKYTFRCDPSNKYAL